MKLLKKHVMNKQKLGILTTLLMVVCISLPVSTANATFVSFDQSGASLGSIDSTTGKLVGNNINFNSFLASDTSNDGSYATNASLSFETGDFVSVIDDTWTFGAGGSFTLTVDSVTGLSTPTVISGVFEEEVTVSRQDLSFFGPPSYVTDPLSFSLDASATSGDLLTALGFSSPEATITVGLTLGNLALGANNSFTTSVTSPDLVMTPVPTVPSSGSTVVMLGIGLMSLCGTTTLRRKS